MSKDEFVGCEETTNLFRKVEKLFDLLNTKIIHGSGSKAQLCADNMKEWENAIIGFASATKSLLDISTDLLTQTQPYKYMH